MLITIGSFQDIRDVGFLCTDTKEDAVFYQNFISQKILERVNQNYEGQVLMVNEVFKINLLIRNQETLLVLKDYKMEFL